MDKALSFFLVTVYLSLSGVIFCWTGCGKWWESCIICPWWGEYYTQWFIWYSDPINLIKTWSIILLSHSFFFLFYDLWTAFVFHCLWFFFLLPLFPILINLKLWLLCWKACPKSQLLNFAGNKNLLKNHWTFAKIIKSLSGVCFYFAGRTDFTGKVMISRNICS